MAQEVEKFIHFSMEGIPVRYRDVDKILRKAGWYEVRQKGSHHQYACEGKSTVVTVPEHGGRDISKGVLRSIEEGTGLSLRR